VDILWSALAAIPAAILGIVALSLARDVRRRAALALGRVRGERAASVGRTLGFLAVYLAVTTGLAVGFYALLAVFGD
jgi:hypothetical protein